jgi:uncharacterized repeat protein (TIGR03803 family)
MKNPFGALTLAVLSAVLLLAARPAQAQTETVLYNFAGPPDGADSYSSLTPDGRNNFYGTTYAGGLGYGTVFELSPNGNGGWNETVLHSFTGGADGAYPTFSNVIFDDEGNLYGTAAAGGANGYGVVFELSPAGDKWTETVLYSFGYGTDGQRPAGSLVMDSMGNLYGTCAYIVFELSPSGGGWTETTIYESGFGFAGLTMDTTGNLYGTTQLDSKSAYYSTVFELSPNGSGGWIPTVLHTFPHGSVAEGTLVVDKGGHLYGTTTPLGSKSKSHGLVYKLSPGVGKWTAKTLYSFKGGTDGASPYAGVVFDAAGNIYGTTSIGGASGEGTVFELVAPVGKGHTYSEKILWSFDSTDGDQPCGSLILDGSGNLYGTTFGGGSKGAGVVFEVTP